MSDSNMIPGGAEGAKQRRAGAALSYVSLFVGIVTSFVYVPLLLSFLTTEEYGVYELIGSIIAYLSVMDMGLSTTLNRFYVKIKTDGTKRDVENLLAMSGIVYGVLTVLAVAAGVAVNWAIEPLFGASFSPLELGLMHQMMVLVILNCLIILPGNWFLAIINANERFVFAMALSIFKYIAQLVCVFFILTWHSSALMVLTAQVFVNALCVACYVLYCRQHLRVMCKLHFWDWSLARNLFSFSFFILLSMVFDQIFWKTGQIVLGVVSGASAVASYGIVCRVVVSGFSRISGGISGVFLPRVTLLSALSSDMTEINRLFKKIGHLQAILTWGVCAAFAVLGQEFIYLWAGSEFGDVYPATLILMLSLCIPFVQSLGLTTLQAKNKMGFRSFTFTIFAVINVIVSIPVSAKYGVIGCACVTALVLFIANGLVLNIYYVKAIGLDVLGLYRKIFPLLIPIILTSVLTWEVGAILWPDYSWATFVVKCLVFIAVYFCTLFIKGFDSYERSLLSNVTTKVLILFRKQSS